MPLSTKIARAVPIIAVLVTAVVAAAAEVETYVIDPPEYLKGKDFWIPLGKGKLNGISPIRRQGDWALIRPLNSIVRVTNATR